MNDSYLQTLSKIEPVKALSREEWIKQNVLPLAISDDWKERFKAEYKMLNSRVESLETIICYYQKDKLDFKPNCSIELLKSQLGAMQSYLNILKERAKIEGIELSDW